MSGKILKKILVALFIFLMLISWIGMVLYYQIGMGTILIRKFIQPQTGHRIAPLYAEEEYSLACKERRIPIRVYRPLEGYEKIIIAVHGVHFDGYREKRLNLFAEKLAELGFAVVIPEIEDLKNYSIVPRAVEDIEQVTLWTLDQSRLVKNPHKNRVGLLGFSFSGGLCLSAAGRDSLKNRISFLFSFGGHGDLDRTMKYLVTGVLPDGKKMPAHIYAVAVVLLRYVDYCVEPYERKTMKECLIHYLREEGKQMEQKAKSLGKHAQYLLQLCNERKSEELGKILEPFIHANPLDSSLSPVRFRPPQCPIFLLHGSEDIVIPPSETILVAEWSKKWTSTYVLISPLICHVELEESKSTWKDFWNLASFLTAFLRS